MGEVYFVGRLFRYAFRRIIVLGSITCMFTEHLAKEEISLRLNLSITKRTEFAVTFTGS